VKISALDAGGGKTQPAKSVVYMLKKRSNQEILFEINKLK